MLRFYTEFAAAFGTLILGIFTFALITQENIGTGTSGFVVTVLVAFGYAMVRAMHRESLRHEEEILAARARRDSTV